MRLWGNNHKNKVVSRAQDKFHNPLFIVLMAVKKKLDHKKLIDNNSHYHVCIKKNPAIWITKPYHLQGVTHSALHS